MTQTAAQSAPLVPSAPACRRLSPAGTAPLSRLRTRTLLPGAEPVSPKTLEQVDSETHRIVDAAEDEVVELLRRERSRLDALAAALLQHETLDQEDAYRIAGMEQPELDPEQEARAAASPLRSTAERGCSSPAFSSSRSGARHSSSWPLRGRALGEH